MEGAVGFTSLGFTMGGVRIGGEVDKVKKAKMDKSYAHLIQDIPGAHPHSRRDWEWRDWEGWGADCVVATQDGIRSRRTSTSATSS